MDLRARAAVLAGVVAFVAPAGASAAPAPALTPAAPLDAALSGGWRGGAVTASTGEAVHVYVYGGYGDEAGTAAFLQSFADFLAWLPHGPVELAAVNAEAAPLAVVKGICGAAALACYLRGTHELVVPANDGELPPTPGLREQLIAREFGSAIADFRNNAPWEAVDTGPKFWATAEHVCERAAAGLVYPGADDDARLPLNPGAAWAESYRRTIEDVTPRWGTLAWDVDASFLTQDGLAAVIRDVTEAWARPRSILIRASLTRANSRRFVRGLSTPLDGSFTATLLSGPRDATVRVKGLSDSVGFPTQFSGRVCGSRQVSIVVSGPRRGAFRLAVSAP